MNNNASSLRIISVVLGIWYMLLGVSLATFEEGPVGRLARLRLPGPRCLICNRTAVESHVYEAELGSGYAGTHWFCAIHLAPGEISYSLWPEADKYVYLAGALGMILVGMVKACQMITGTAKRDWKSMLTPPALFAVAWFATSCQAMMN